MRRLDSVSVIWTRRRLLSLSGLSLKLALCDQLILICRYAEGILSALLLRPQ